MLAALLAVVMSSLPLIGIAHANPTGLEAGAGTATINGTPPMTMSFPLGRTGDLGFDTWLRYRTENGSAVAGSDYNAAEGEVEVPAGSSSANIPVGILGKSAFAPDKQLALQLESATGVGPTPTFAERVTFPTTGGISTRATVGDINGDGRPDVIVPHSIGEISVLLDTTPPGSSTPSLAASQNFPVEDSPEAATPIDINGDGRPDLVIADGRYERFSILINTTPSGSSTVSFAPEQIFEEAGAGPSHPVLADINGDGRPDLVLVNDQFFEHAVSVFFNTTPPGATTARFTPRQYFEFFAPNGLAFTDVNGDGRPDLVITSSAGANEVVVILNETPLGGTDLVLGEEVDLPVGTGPNLVRTADFNGDGKPDLAVSNLQDHSVSVLLNETAPGASVPAFAPRQDFGLVGGDQRSIQAVDLNGDGKPDLVTGDPAGHDLTILTDTTAIGSMRASFTKDAIEAEPLPLGLSAADFNGDGRPDLSYTRESGKVSVAVNTTPRTTAVAPSLAGKHDALAGGGPSGAVPTDFNGDGRPDVAVADRRDDDLSVLLDATAPGATTPGFAGRQAFAAGDAPSAVAAADFNLDGKPDLAVADEGADTASVLLDTTAPGATAPSFAAGQAFAVGGAPSAVATADFNGDGKPDLAVADRDDDDVSVLLDDTASGASTPSFLARGHFPVGAAPTSVAAVDVNLDGKPDLVVANHDDDTATVLLNTTAPGSTTASFAPGVALATGSLPSSIAATDLNGDSKPDLVVANEGSDSVSVLFDTTAPGATSPSFAAAQAFPAGDGPSSVAVADLDGDGIPDLLVADLDGDTASVLLNTTQPGATTPAFGQPKGFPTGAGPSGVTAADLNGDGGPDVITADGAGDAISALLDTQYTASVGPPSVTGTIRYAIPKPTLEPGSLDFGAEVLGTTATKTVTLANEGGASLAIAGIGIASGTGFVQTNDCPSDLAVGSSCSIAVSFAPGSTGAAKAALTVTDNVPSGPSVVALNGSGTAPPSPPKGGGGTPPGGSPPPSQATARLRIRKASQRTGAGRLRISLVGTIAGSASGKVIVKAKYRIHGRAKTATKQATIATGTWSAQLVLPAGIASGSPVDLAARFAGSPGVASGHAERRLSAR